MFVSEVVELQKCLQLLSWQCYTKTRKSKWQIFPKKKKIPLFTYNSENSRNWLVLGSNLPVSLEISFVLDSVAVLWQVVAVCFLQHRPHQGRQLRSTSSCRSHLHLFPCVASRCFCETEVWPFLGVLPSCPCLGAGTLQRTSALCSSARITRQILIVQNTWFHHGISHVSIMDRTPDFIMVFHTWVSWTEHSTLS